MRWNFPLQVPILQRKLPDKETFHVFQYHFYNPSQFHPLDKPAAFLDMPLHNK